VPAHQADGSPDSHLTTVRKMKVDLVSLSFSIRARTQGKATVEGGLSALEWRAHRRCRPGTSGAPAPDFQRLAMAGWRSAGTGGF
jgi:hypothetical protein